MIWHIKDSILVQLNKTVTTKENCAYTHWIGIYVGGFVLKQCVPYDLQRRNAFDEKIVLVQV